MLFYVMEEFVISFTVRPSDLNTTLTYLIMDNFCLCFLTAKKCWNEKN